MAKRDLLQNIILLNTAYCSGDIKVVQPSVAIMDKDVHRGLKTPLNAFSPKMHLVNFPKDVIIKQKMINNTARLNTPQSLNIHLCSPGKGSQLVGFWGSGAQYSAFMGGLRGLYSSSFIHFL